MLKKLLRQPIPPLTKTEKEFCYVFLNSFEFITFSNQLLQIYCKTGGVSFNNFYLVHPYFSWGLYSPSLHRLIDSFTREDWFDYVLQIKISLNHVSLWDTSIVNLIISSSSQSTEILVTDGNICYKILIIMFFWWQ